MSILSKLQFGAILDVSEPLRPASRALDSMSLADRLAGPANAASRALSSMSLADRLAGPANAASRALGSMSLADRLAGPANAASRALSSMSLATQLANSASAMSRALDSMRSTAQLPDFANQVSAASGAEESMPTTVQMPDLASQAPTPSCTLTADDCDLAAEVQNCAIELLALLKEDEPDLEISNREKFAWDLACAEFDFLIDMLRLTGRITDLYSHTSSASTDRFTEFRQRD